MSLHDYILQLEEVWKVQRPLLDDFAERHVAASHLLAGLSDFLIEVDSIHESAIELPSSTIKDIVGVLLSYYGTGNCYMRSEFLRLLPFCRSEPRQVVLDYLPTTIPPDVSEDVTMQVVDALQKIPRDGVLPVLGCLGRMHLEEHGRHECVELCLSVLTEEVKEEDLPTLARTLVTRIKFEVEALPALTAIRHECQLLEASVNANDTMLAVADIVVSGFFESESGGLLVRTYLKIVEQDENESTLLDLIVLCGLMEQDEFSDLVDKVIFAWLVSDRLRTRRLSAFLDLVCGSAIRELPVSSLHQRLTNSLVSTAIFLLLSTVRVKLSALTIETIRTFSVKLHGRLDHEHQAEFVQCLLHLSEEVGPIPTETSGRKRKREREVSSDARRSINDSVYFILESIAQSSPASLRQFQHVLMERLTAMTMTVDVGTTKAIARVLPQLLGTGRDCEGLDSASVLTLLQKLLFSSSMPFQRNHLGDTTRVQRGLMLATELLRSKVLSSTDVKCVQDWVLQILLPPSRRAIEPELGCPGVDFLEAWMGCNSVGSKEAFKHFRALLSNTGLIQTVQQFRQTGRHDKSVLAYTSVPPELSTSVPSVSRDMVFCVGYFLRRMDMQSHFRWVQTTHWVFKLVDSYLRLGRETAQSSWRPDGWLRAAIELPAELFDHKESRHGDGTWQEVTNLTLLIEDKSGGRSEGDWLDSSTAHLQPRTDLDGILVSSLTFWVAVAVSSAVLKNAVDHYKISGDGGRFKESRLMDLLQFQLMKILCLKSKLRLLKQMMETICQETPKLAAKRSHSKSHGAHKTADKAVQGVTATDALTEAFFDSTMFLSVDALWICLTNSEDDLIVRKALSAISVGHESDEEVRNGIRLLAIKCSFVDALNSLVAKTPRHLNQQPETIRAYFAHCMTWTSFLMDLLPQLRIRLFSRGVKVRASPFMMLCSLHGICGNRLTVTDGQECGTTPFGKIVRFVVCYFRLLKLLMLSVVDTPANLEFCCLDGFSSIRHCTGFVAVQPSIDDVVRWLLSLHSSAEIQVVAASILEAATVLVFPQHGRWHEDLIVASWASLNNIFPQGDWDSIIDDIPFSVTTACVNMADRADETLKRVFERSISQIMTDTDAMRGHFQIVLLQYWGLVFQEASVLLRFATHLEVMVDHLSSSISLARGLRYLEEKKEGDRSSGQSFGSRVPFPFLCAGVIDIYFCQLLGMLIAALAFSESTTTAGIDDVATGPFDHLALLIRNVGRLLALYELESSIFKQKSAVSLYCMTRLALQAAMAQARRCVAWRSAQPPLTWDERECGVLDKGALCHLRDLVSVMYECLVLQVSKLGDFWQGSGRHKMLSQGTRLKRDADLALAALDRISVGHNFEFRGKTGDFLPESAPSKDSMPVSVGKGTRKSATVLKGDHESMSEAESDSDGSFGARGNWGSSDDDT